MSPRPTARWLLVGLLVLAPALTAHAASADEASQPSAPVDVSRLATPPSVTELFDRDIAPARPPHDSHDLAHMDRETCRNEKSVWWLPDVALPAHDQPGQLALGWRPRELLSEPSSRAWIAGALAALVLVSVLDLALRRRGPQWLAIVAATGPGLVGFALAHRHLGWLADGISQPWWFIPRETIFQRNAQLARDTLTLGAMASLPAFAMLLVLSLFPWRSSRLRTHVPAFALLALAAWLTWRHWPDGREGELARQVSEPLGAIAADGIRLPAASGMTVQRLPDVPLLLVSADGTLRYDDSRGLRSPTALPLLPPISGRVVEPANSDDVPPSFLMAIDERTSWQALQGDLAPLNSQIAFAYQQILLGSASPTTPGASPRWATSYLNQAMPASCRLRGPHEDIKADGWLDEHGLRIHSDRGDLLAGCEQWGTGMTIARDALEDGSLIRCFKQLLDHQSYDTINIHLMPSPSTTWREIAQVLRAADRSQQGNSSLEFRDRIGITLGSRPTPY